MTYDIFIFLYFFIYIFYHNTFDHNDNYLLNKEIDIRNMDSTILEKKKLYDTLLSFPPFYTFYYSNCKTPRTSLIKEKTN
jgi:hypothetical protein